MQLDNCVIIINKPCGQTSHEITTEVKKILGVSRSGHAGTLDPQVSGVLPVALGKATKLIRYIASKEKTYVCLMKFKELMPEEKIRALFEEFTGRITQTPPKISAVRKVPRQRTIHKLRILEISGHFVLFEATVEAGTYIRTLCDDMGRARASGQQPSGARMEELRRIAVGKIKENQAHTMQDLIDAVWVWKNKNDDSLLRGMLKPPETFIDYPKVVVKESAIEQLKQGAQLTVPGILRFDSKVKKGERVALYSEKGKFVGVGLFLVEYEDFVKSTKGIAVRTERIHI
ncbi:MAG: RNA-guided pseudouridylation complex pseudouridine synthase subunit Cbf5 [Desulfobulbaceae bacterium]|nr:RNA-guided pseudouridylation complex pseudouridine synthase subunit Cbf5 [Desulfobulbaceae bacterium]